MDINIFFIKIDKKISLREQWCKIRRKFWSKINMINLNTILGSFLVPTVSTGEDFVQNRGQSDG